MTETNYTTIEIGFSTNESNDAIEEFFIVLYRQNGQKFNPSEVRQNFKTAPQQNETEMERKNRTNREYLKLENDWL